MKKAYKTKIKTMNAGRKLHCLITNIKITNRDHIIFNVRKVYNEVHNGTSKVVLGD